jgi:hypothetical protein
MGNCSGFCVSNNTDEQPKKVSADKVKTALNEKDELFREGARFEDVR